MHLGNEVFLGPEQQLADCLNILIYLPLWRFLSFGKNLAGNNPSALREYLIKVAF
ncbi:hypothetical protein [Geomonas silvestris]|uniref:hypothetical protein n=1 Tax=Geomonas silvestris TaxID=2740184 RepID=UPI0016167B7F|nr:hypothetical protein [Geomonas silvestris]